MLPADAATILDSADAPLELRYMPLLDYVIAGESITSLVHRRAI